MRWRFVLFAWLALLPAVARAESDVTAIDAWAAHVVGDGIAQGRSANAVVTVVRGGKVLLNRGYGAADRPRGRAVDPNADQFLLASISKTFTAAAIAQLVEQGRIASLDDPANKYLKRVRLPSRDGKDVTLRELLTHSAGFEERGYGFARHGVTGIPASGDFVRSAVPALVRTPGTRIVYANIDPPILGMVIEDITGRTLQAYLAQHVFAPLGMRHTVLNYAADGGPSLVQEWSAAGFAPRVLNAPFFAPTGSVQTTGADMAVYMAAMFGAAPRVLTPSMIARLWTPLMRNDAALTPLAMAWFLPQWNGVGVAEHAGGFSGFASWLILIPAQKTGLFIAWGEDSTRPGQRPFGYTEIHDGFLRAALGPHEPLPRLTDQSGLARFVGRYWRERRPHTNPEVLLSIDAMHDAALRKDGLYVDGDGPFHLVAPGVIARDTDGTQYPTRYVLSGDELLAVSDYSRRVSAIGDPHIFMDAAFGLIALCLGGLIAMFWMAKDRWGLGLAALGAALLPAALFWPGLDGMGFEGDVILGRPWRFDVLFAAGCLLAVSAALLLAGLGRSLVARRPVSAAQTAYGALVAFSAATLVVLLALIGTFRLPGF